MAPAFLTRGQPAALASIAQGIRSGRPPHALLLVGPARVGKTTLALDLCAGLLCEADQRGDRPCGTCLACRKVRRGVHPDVHRISPEGPGGQIRLARIHELQGALALHPLEGRWRVAILEAAHRLNQDAQNALLKTLEEPPPATVIVLAAEDESLLLPTVRSRCARVRLRPVDSAALVELLGSATGIDAPRAARLGRLAGGRPGLALALARDPEAELVHARLVRTLLDLAGADRRDRLSAAGSLLADAATLVEAGDRAAEPTGGIVDAKPAPNTTDDGRPAGKARRAPPPAERRRALVALLDTWRGVGRDLAVAAHGGPGLIRSVELLEEVSTLAVELDEQALTTFLARIDGLATAVEAYANPDLVLDALLLAWPRARRETPASRAEPSAA